MLLYWDLTTFVSCFGYSTSHVTFLLRDVGAGIYKKDRRPRAASLCLQSLDYHFLWTKMPRFCVATNCTNTSARDNVSMFGFPVNNPVVLRKWVNVQSLPQGSHSVVSTLWRHAPFFTLRMRSYRLLRNAAISKPIWFLIDFCVRDDKLYLYIRNQHSTHYNISKMTLTCWVLL